jgi:hypothetical protein
MLSLLLICQGGGDLKHDSGSKATYAYRSYAVYLHVLKEGECSGTLMRVPPLCLTSYAPHNRVSQPLFCLFDLKRIREGLYVMHTATALIHRWMCYMPAFRLVTGCPHGTPPFQSDLYFALTRI